MLAISTETTPDLNSQKGPLSLMQDRASPRNSEDERIINLKQVLNSSSNVKIRGIYGVVMAMFESVLDHKVIKIRLNFIGLLETYRPRDKVLINFESDWEYWEFC